jgi:hypothetical protein
LTLPRLFAGQNASDPAPIFVGFGFNYDVGQLVAGMPYQKAWELRNGLPWDERENDEYPESLRRWVLVGGYAISHISRKSVVLANCAIQTNRFDGVRRKGLANASAMSIMSNVSKSMMFTAFSSRAC